MRPCGSKRPRLAQSHVLPSRLADGERLFLRSSFAPLRSRSSTSCAVERTAAELCGRGTVNSLSELCALRPLPSTFYSKSPFASLVAAAESCGPPSHPRTVKSLASVNAHVQSREISSARDDISFFAPRSLRALLTSTLAVAGFSLDYLSLRSQKRELLANTHRMRPPRLVASLTETAKKALFIFFLCSYRPVVRLRTSLSGARARGRVNVALAVNK